MEHTAQYHYPESPTLVAANPSPAVCGENKGYTYPVSWVGRGEWLLALAKGGQRFVELTQHYIYLGEPPTHYEYQLIDKIEYVNEDVRVEEEVNLNDCVRSYDSWDGQGYELDIPSHLNGKTCRLDTFNNRLVFKTTEHVRELRFHARYNGKSYVYRTITDLDNLRFGYTTYPTGEIRSLIIASWKDEGEKVEDFEMFYEFRSCDNAEIERKRIQNTVEEAINVVEWRYKRADLTVQQFCRKVARWLGEDKVSYASKGKAGLQWVFAPDSVDNLGVLRLAHALALFGYNPAGDKEAANGSRTIIFKRND